MITVEQYMKAINYRVTSGSEYQWKCYGPHARYIDCDQNDFSVSIIFDAVDQTVYEATVCDYINNRAYRRFNPDFHKQFLAESKERDVTSMFAWDAVKFVDLETDEDWIEKTTAIVNKMPYDERVSIPLDLSDEEILVLMKMAHERDVTFNNFIEAVLWEKLKSLENNAPKIKANKTKKFKKKSKDNTDKELS